MKHIFKNKTITGILSVLPPKRVCFEEEVANYPFPEKQSLKLAKVMGYHTRRVCEKKDALSGYALYGLNYLMEKGLLDKDDIDAIIVVSSSQDYIIPPVSYVIQGKLSLSDEVMCMDISQACGGYIVGLIQAFMLLDTFKLKKVVLVTGDLLSKKVGQRDRSSRPIIGDAVNITLVENTVEPNEIPVMWKNYGKDAAIIEIPAGGLKMPSTPETAVEQEDEFGNFRAKDHFYMEGEEVFNFVMREVPPMVEELIQAQGILLDKIDYFLFHQPNKYMVQKLADELDIPYDKMFSNIVGLYGNASSGTIPLNICHNIADKAVATDQLKVCLSGFGAGLTCNALLMDLGKMDFCRIIDFAG